MGLVLVMNIVIWLFSFWVFFASLNRFLGLQKISFGQKFSLYWPVVLVQLLPAFSIILSALIPVLLMGMRGY